MKSFKSLLFIIYIITVLPACKKEKDGPIEELIIPENPATFKEVSTITLGTTGAAEISAYDPLTKRLFVVNNAVSSKVDVIDISQLPVISKIQTLDFSSTSGVANSVAVSNGLLAVALEATVKTDNGSVAIINTTTLSETKRITVGALPDMVTFSPDGKYIVTANEGEPNADYSVDPVGSVSIIDIKNNYSVKTLDFSAFESSLTMLKAGGFRVYGLNATMAKDVEPEYVAISANSKRAWVTLQENNAIAEIDLSSGAIYQSFTFGGKRYKPGGECIRRKRQG
ncbi:hypothetical protein WG906_01465 [Pedobacter sp. P351]|uniref:choice-of-anchor I domain-containing protein n=1 Tax=Pedobacter superstes TaxID=3133441 RepID=UPI0030B69A70